MYAILQLYEAAFETTDPDQVKGLDGQVLAFSVSHNNKLVNLYGHYAVRHKGVRDKDDVVEGVGGGRWNFYRYDIDLVSLTLRDGADRFKPYNFVRRLYYEFVAQHLQRIKHAIAAFPTPTARTGLLFNTSDLTLEEEEGERGGSSAGSPGGGAIAG